MKVGVKVYRKYLFPLDKAKELDEFQMFDGVFYVNSNGDYINEAESTAVELATIAINKDIGRNSDEHTFQDVGERHWVDTEGRKGDDKDVVTRSYNHIVSSSTYDSHIIFLYRIDIRYRTPKG